MLLGMVWLCGYDVTLVDAPNPEENDAYRWIQELVSGNITSSELASLVRKNAVRRLE